MIKKIKILILSLMSLGIMLIPATAMAYSEIQNELCGGTGTETSGITAGGNCGTDVTSSTGSIAKIIGTIITFFSWIVGGISVIMIIYGGFRYVTSGGNDQSVSGAKNTIVYALIGLVIVALAQVIVHFVLNKAINVGS